MKLRVVAVVAGALLVQGSAVAQGIGARRGDIPGGTLSTTPGLGGVGVSRQLPGGTLSTQPGVGGVGVPGQVPGGTLSTRPGVGGIGVPGQLPGGTLAPIEICGGGPCTRVLVVPGLVVPVPASDGPVPAEAGAPAE